MKSLSESLPYILLAVVAVVVLFQVLAPYVTLESLLQEDLVGQLGHWVSGGSTTVTMAESPGQATEPGQPAPEPGEPEAGQPEVKPSEKAVAVIAYSIETGWWNREPLQRERDAGQFLAVLLDAGGELGVETWGISGVGLQGAAFAIFLEHADPLVLREVVRQLIVLPASEWFRAQTIFYGKPAAASASLSATVSDEVPLEQTYAALVLEERSSDWFLLSGAERTQLLAPRVDGLAKTPVGRIRCYDDLGFGLFTDLTVVEGLDLSAMPDLRTALRSHWEQKYVEETWVFIGPRLSATKLMDSLR